MRINLRARTARGKKNGRKRWAKKEKCEDGRRRKRELHGKEEEKESDVASNH